MAEDDPTKGGASGMSGGSPDSPGSLDSPGVGSPEPAAPTPPIAPMPPIAPAVPVYAYAAPGYPPGAWPAPSAPNSWPVPSAPGYPPGAWPAPSAPNSWPAPSAPGWQPPYAAPAWTPQQVQWAMPPAYQPAYQPGYQPAYQPGYQPAYPQSGWVPRPSFAPPVVVPPGPEPGMKWGGVGIRLGAIVIDAIIVVVSYFGLAFGLAASGQSTRTGEISPAATAAVLAWMLFALAYHPVCWYVFGATPGQKVLGLRVAQASSGESLGVSAVLIRFVIFAFTTVMIPVGIISAVMTSQDPFKRAWHDEIARSIVVKRGY